MSNILNEYLANIGFICNFASINSNLMKKTNLVYLLSTLIFFSMFIATSCEEDNNPPTTITLISENPMYKNKIEELNSYIGLTYNEIKTILIDSLGRSEYYKSNEDDGMRYHYFESPGLNNSNKKIDVISVHPDTSIYIVHFNPFINKVAGVSYLHFYDYITLIDLYEGYSKSLHNTTPANKWFRGKIYCKDSTIFVSTEREEFVAKFKEKKYVSYYCIEQFDRDSTYNIVSNDSSSFFRNKQDIYATLRYTSIRSGNRRYERNPYQDK